MATPVYLNSTTRALLLIAVAVLSIGWTIYDWGNLNFLKDRLIGVEYVAIGLLLTEALFIVGALVMLAAVGEKIPSFHPRRWVGNVNFLKKEIKAISSRAISSRLFGFGFWLNFIGAVGTSVILMLGVVRLFPIQAWGLLLILVIDLLATFGWRVPLQMARKKA
jgi:hypothetical protein